jgi:hypothetical protein
MFLTRKEDLMPFSGLLEEGAQSWRIAELMLFKPFFMATVEIFEAQEGEDEPFSMMRTWMADDVHTFVDLASKQNKNDIELRSVYVIRTCSEGSREGWQMQRVVAAWANEPLGTSDKKFFVDFIETEDGQLIGCTLESLGEVAPQKSHLVCEFPKGVPEH